MPHYPHNPNNEWGKDRKEEDRLRNRGKRDEHRAIEEQLTELEPDDEDGRWYDAVFEADALSWWRSQQ